MKSDVMNCYYEARKIACFTRIYAADMLSVSERTLADYELNVRPVPDETVLLMSKVYNAPWLKLKHLEKNIIFKDVFGNFPINSNRALNVLAMQKEVADVVQSIPLIIKRTLSNLSLGEDMLKELKECCNACLVLIENEKEKPLTNAANGSR